MCTRRRTIISTVLFAVATAAGCASTVQMPTPNADFDYEIGGAYPPPNSVAIVSRDRHDPPASGRYSICYVNGFQAQPEDEDWWLANHPTLVLHDAADQPMKDTEWNELILDISTQDKRTELGAIVGDWVDGCGRSGFEAVEVDNLDSYTRSQGLLSEEDAVDFARILSDRAHAANLAIGQKNASDLVTRRSAMGTDFAVVEGCNRYRECDRYTEGYGTSVFVIEYRRTDFDRGCRDWPGLSIVLRDRDVLPAEAEGHVRDSC